MTPATKAGVLGAADGVVSVSGVIAAGVTAGQSSVTIGVIALGLAAAATVSMAGAELLSEDRARPGTVAAMAVGTLAGAGLPGAPLLAARGAIGWGLVLAVAVCCAAAVAEVRHRCSGRGRTGAYMATGAVLAAGALVGAAAGMIPTGGRP